MIREGMFYNKKENGTIVCFLCPHNCHLREGQVGICGVRKVNEGILQTINYGEISSLAMDPIEKKPLYHFKPGRYILSAGSFGCNLSCGFCQNYSISREVPETKYIEPERLVKITEEYMSRGSAGIAFTYNEPSIFFEYIYDFSRLAVNKIRDINIILVTNGYISREPLKELLPYIDAMNIDLKAFNNNFYSKVCSGGLQEVMSTIETASSSCHIEITTLVIGGYNDDEKEVEELAKWLGSVDRDIPLHLTRYHPAYKFKEPPTPVETIMRAADIAGKYLNHVYVGNVPGADSNTYCPECGAVVIERNSYEPKILMEEGKCKNCEHKINIVL